MDKCIKENLWKFVTIMKQRRKEMPNMQAVKTDGRMILVLEVKSNG